MKLTNVLYLQVRRLELVSCRDDPAWVLQLLQASAPLLEELKLSYPRQEHLFALRAMPRLWRLSVTGSSTSQAALPADLVLPPLPSHHVGLRWFKASRLPRDTLASLLRSHGHSLRELQLVVGTAGTKAWPLSCGDLHTMLRRCDLRELPRLVLWKCDGYSHSEPACRDRLQAVRGVLPGTAVQCYACDKDPAPTSF